MAGFRHALKTQMEEVVRLISLTYDETNGGSTEEAYALDARNHALDAKRLLTDYVLDDTCNKRHPDGFICTRPDDHEGLHVAGFHDVSMEPVAVWGVSGEQQVNYLLSDRRWSDLITAVNAHADRN